MLRTVGLKHFCRVQGFDLLVDMLAVEPMVVLNAAFCELHRKRCPPSEQLLRECSYVSTCPSCYQLSCCGMLQAAEAVAAIDLKPRN